MRDAIGPDKNAIEAIGPEIDVANAIRITEQKISNVLITPTFTPSIFAYLSPSSRERML